MDDHDLLEQAEQAMYEALSREQKRQAELIHLLMDRVSMEWLNARELAKEITQLFKNK